MMKRTISWLLLTLLLAGTIFLAFYIKPAEATAVTVYINSNGSTSPVSAPISSSDNITYTLTGNISYPTYAGIVVARSNIVINGNGFTVQGNQTSPSGNGIDLTDTNNVTIKNTVIQYFDYGIYLVNSNRESIIQNSATSNTYDGITLDSSSNNNYITGNIVTANTNGISIYSSSNNTIAGNYAAGNGYGIYLSSSSYNTISGNTATASNISGIYLYSSSNNTINLNNATANPSATGILLYSSSNNTISANTAGSNNAGIELTYSSSYNGVSGNIAASNHYGLWLYVSSNHNTIIGNNVTSNTIYGIYLVNLSSSIIYNNDFINNTPQTNLSNSANTWDNGYPSGGNYWSDYNGTDSYRGLYQNVTGIDGIGDTPYVMAGNNTDHYPLMGPFGSSTFAGLNVTVFPSDDVGLIFQNVTVAGSTTVNEMQTYAPALANLTGEYYDVRVSANYAGNITVRLIFDGSNMTQLQKSSLKLMQYTPLAGDITGQSGVPDGKVDIRDISLIAKAFGSSPGQPNWNPICDLNGDNRTDIRDISIAAKNFGLSTNWVNITTSVDTADNVIYGITTHFSIIGIHQE